MRAAASCDPPILRPTRRFERLPPPDERSLVTDPQHAMRHPRSVGRRRRCRDSGLHRLGQELRRRESGLGAKGSGAALRLDHLALCLMFYPRGPAEHALPA